MSGKGKKKIRESDRQVDTVARALDILRCFSTREPELSLKALNEKTGLYKSRILRLCGTLKAQHFLIKTSRSTDELGPQVMILGKIYEKTNTLINLAGPILQDLMAATGESTALFILEGNQRFCLIKRDGPSPIRYSIGEGDPLPLYAGAPGKVLLAFAPPEERREILSRTVLKKITSTTITDVNELEREMETIRRQGYAVSRGEVVPEALSLAAPVFDHESRVRLAIQIGAPYQRLTSDKWPEMIPKLLEATERLSIRLGKGV